MFARVGSTRFCKGFLTRCKTYSILGAQTDTGLRMGTLYKKGSLYWQVAVCVKGRQICRSTHTTNKRRAQQVLAQLETEAFEQRFHLPRSKPPYFEDWADEFLATIGQPNTRRRYASSVTKLKFEFAGFGCRISLAKE